MQTSGDFLLHIDIKHRESKLPRKV